jgi:hypothetical protein
MAPAQLAQVGLDFGRYLVGAAVGPVRPVGKRLQAAGGGVAAQPAVDGLAADAVALGDLHHREPITKHLHDGAEALFCHRELQKHAPDLLASTWSGRSRGRSGGGVNHQPEPWNPAAGINTSSLNRVSKYEATG